MATRKGRVENLIPQNMRTKEEQRAIAKMGGKKSVEVRRERKLMSQIYAEILADKSKIDLDGDGQLKELTGEQLVKEVSKRILAAGGSPAVSLIKELREGTEGQSVNVAGKDGAPLAVAFTFAAPPKDADHTSK